MVRVWEYDVAAESVAAFEQAYSADGDWARLFASAPGYLGTELFASVDTPGRYLTVDRFADGDAWKQFLDEHRDAYARLDAQTAGLTLAERELM